MSDKPAVLKAHHAHELLVFTHNAVPQECTDQLRSIATGRTVVVPVMSEDEAREAFVDKVNTTGMSQAAWESALHVWFAALRYAKVLR